MPRYYPVTLNLEGQTCLVVGGGAVADRKVKTLIAHQARVVLVSPDVSDSLRELADLGRIELHQRPFVPEDTDGVFLVFCATNDREVNRGVVEACQNRRVLVNVVDDPELCSFLVPAIHRQGPLSIAVSTDGNSPSAARLIRQHLEKEFGPEYGRLLEMVGAARRKIIGTVGDPEKRTAILKELVDEELLALIRSGDVEAAKERLAKCLSSWLG